MNDTYDYVNDVPFDYHGIAHAHDYYELFNGQFVESLGFNNETSGALVTDCILRGVSALVGRIGFILIQAGSIPVENIYSIVLYNIIEICLVLMTYGFIGNWFAFGSKSANGWIGHTGKHYDSSAKFSNIDGAIIGFCSSLLATAQMSTFIAGRIYMAAGMILTVFYCGLFQPLLLHWIWFDKGWMNHSKLMRLRVSLKDHAGALVIHIPSVLFGMIGSFFLGRRVLRLKDVDKLSFGTETAVNTIIGYILIITNYIIFALPNWTYHKTHYPEKYSAIVIANSFIALAGGMLAMIILQLIAFRDIYTYRRAIRCIQGGIAGLITVASAVDLYTPTCAVLMAAGMATLFFFFAEVLHKTALEDPCSFISSHLICGFIGLIFCPLLVPTKTEGANPKVYKKIIGLNTLWQFLCALVVISFTLLFALFIFLFLKICGILRSDSERENHKRAEVIRDSLSKRGFLERLFVINNGTNYVVPGYRKIFFDSYYTEAEKNASITDESISEEDKVRKVAPLRQEGDKQFDATVMRFNTEQDPTKIKINRHNIGSGDYFNSHRELKPMYNIREPTKVSRKYNTSWKGFNEI